MIIHRIADIFRKTPFFVHLRSAYSFLVPNLRKWSDEQKNDLKILQDQVGKILQYPLNNLVDKSKSVLIMGSGNVKIIAQESIIRKSFELAGYRCKVMVPQERMIIKAYKKLGSDELIFIDHFKPQKLSEGVFLLNRCKTIEDICNVKFNGVRCGKYAISTLMRTKRSGSFDLSCKEIRYEISQALDRSIQYIKAASKILDKHSPNALVLVDRGYSPSGEFFDLCLNRGIPIYTWNAAHRDNTLMLKRYNKTNELVHPVSLSKQTWSKLKKMAWTQNKANMIINEIESCYLSGEWYGEVGTQFNKASFDKDHIIKNLDLDPLKKTIVIFSHIFWDATFFWGIDLFESYEHWFIETVRAAIKNESVNWIIKIHPANIVKNKRDGIVGQHSEISLINKLFGELPTHIKVLKADTEINTTSLYKMIDACVTVRGTPGIEAACYGVPVFTAGTGRYDGLGFTIDSKTKIEFLNNLAKIQYTKPLTSIQKELGLKFAFGTFLMRPVSLKLIQMKFSKTKNADLEINFQARSLEDFKEFTDINAIAAWIKSGVEDYIEPNDLIES